jgi:hypothetical protein
MVRQDEIKWIPEAIQSVKRVALEAIKLHYGVTVPNGPKATLLSRMNIVSTEDEVKSMGFVLQGSYTDYDVYDGISLWRNEDGVEILTTNFDGQFKFLGERTREVVKAIVHENRLSRFIRSRFKGRPEASLRESASPIIPSSPYAFFQRFAHCSTRFIPITLTSNPLASKISLGVFPDMYRSINNCLNSYA